MAFLVQDDDGSVDGANAYADADFFRAYHADRNVNVATYADSEIEAALILATEYMDHRFTFLGERGRSAQRTAWPRLGAYDDDGLLRSGIPVEVKEAACEYALIALATPGGLNPTPTRDETGQLVQSFSESVGPISQSKTFVGGASFSSPRFPVADNKLRDLRVTGGNIVRG